MVRFAQHDSAICEMSSRPSQLCDVTTCLLLQIDHAYTTSGHVEDIKLPIDQNQG
jgi:hypothetical protein